MSEGARKITGMSGNDGVDDRWLLPLLMSMLAVGYAWLLLPGDEAGLRLMIRTSGRISLVVFSVAFAAAPVARLIHKPATIWIRRNRRLLGLLHGGRPVDRGPRVLRRLHSDLHGCAGCLNAAVHIVARHS